MNIKIRKFDKIDIYKKVEWINNPDNNQFLHYDIPLEIENTKKWFQNNMDRNDRYDAIIEADGVACGIIGLLNIDKKNNKAEYYITLGETSMKNKGISGYASKLLFEYAFNVLQLNKLYLFTESENIIAQKLFEKIGFKQEGKLKEDLFIRDRYVDRYVYGLTREEFLEGN